MLHSVIFTSISHAQTILISKSSFHNFFQCAHISRYAHFHMVKYGFSPHTTQESHLCSIQCHAFLPYIRFTISTPLWIGNSVSFDPFFVKQTAILIWSYIINYTYALRISFLLKLLNKTLSHPQIFLYSLVYFIHLKIEIFLITLKSLVIISFFFMVRKLINIL